MYTFLIIDDEPVVREGIAENIDWALHGYTLVGSCRDGREGIRAIEELRPDVVLTDICMPFVDGLELAAFVTDRYPATKTILLTGYDEFEYAQEAVKLKVSDFLLKPITPDELRTILDRIRGELDRERSRQEDINTLRRQLRESLPLLRERFLNRLIRGDTNGIDLSRTFQLLNLRLTGPCFNLLVVDPDRAGVDDELAALAVQNAVEAAGADEKGTVAFRTDTDQLVVLLSAPDEAAALRSSIECAEKLSEEVQRSWDMTVSVGVGSPVGDPSLMEESYQNAKAALGQRLVLGPNQIFTVDQVRDDSGALISHREELARKRVVRELKSGSLAQIEAAVNELVSLYRTEGCSIGECSVGMQRLLAEILSAFESLGVHYSQIHQTANDPFGRLGELKTLEAIENWFCELGRSVRSVMVDRQKQHGIEKALEAEEYLAAHYSEAGLSLTRLCRALSVSKSYFSPVFKAQTGTTFVEYLTNLRMEHAKELLTSTDMKTYEVAERVGFSDAHYFSLTFRKQSGMSPTEYRDCIRGAV